mmetsp:Transcript_3903/g.10733  ORF Transcript_3903/g.10733 Transcript_3903/m.10733 type:complete len:692 (-) Transcript_3903:325-2400(-)
MSGRDPFPMQSEEAKRLAASVHDDDDDAAAAGSSDWNRMGTTTAASGPSSGRGVDDGSGAADALTGGSKKKSKRKVGGADIYEQAELDEQDEGGGGGRTYDEEEEFFEEPLRGRGGSALSELPRPVRIVARASTRVAKKVHARMYGDSLPPAEALRTICLASTLFFLIGGYWTLRSLKDPVLTALCGVSAIPKAKMLSVFIVLGVVSIYNRLLDVPNLQKHRLFYMFGSFYFALFASISVMLTHSTIGLPNQVPNYSRVLGWVSYCGIESFGSVMVALFWSFANSNFNLETAKASYGLLVATAQLGSILGPTLVSKNAARWGVPACYFMGASCMLLLQGTMYMYVCLYGTEETKQKEAAGEGGAPLKKKAKAGVLEGLRLFAKHNYIKGIFAISCLFMVEITIVDYTMKVLARDHFAGLEPCERGMSCWDPVTDSPMGMSQDATAEFTSFMGLFGQSTNLLSFVLSLFGTSAVIRKLGLRTTLLLFPTLCLAVIIMVRLHPTLYTVFFAMMILKANSYALNNPTKELLYQPTSSAVKYKAKSWIDIFGARGSKAMGSVVTNAFSDSAHNLIMNGSLVGMAVASFLIWNARYMGRKFDEYMESGHVVGGEDEDGQGGDGDGTDGKAKIGVEMAAAQNEGSDTSCGIYDDDELGREEEGQSDRDGDDEDADEEDDGGEASAANTSGIARLEQV